MSQPNADITLFERGHIRRMWHNETWYYSIVDIVAVLTESPNPRNYWNVLKARLKTEGFDEAYGDIVVLKLQAADKRFRATDTANRATLLRIIQSIPSPRAEPFRQWLAEVGDERIEEIEHPEAAIARVRATYRRKGYNEEWIEARIRNDLIRNELTDEWRDRGAKEGREYAILTNEISTGTFDLAIQAHKAYKLLPKSANLRDHMTPLELALISLGEATVITLHRNRDSQGFPLLQRDAHDAGVTAGKARRMIEEDIGEPVISPTNHLAPARTKRTTEQPPASTGKTTDAAEDTGQLLLFDDDPSSAS